MLKSLSDIIGEKKYLS